jgi:hypothetical protein
VYHEQSLQAPEGQQTLSFQKWSMVHRPAGSEPNGFNRRRAGHGNMQLSQPRSIYGLRSISRDLVVRFFSGFRPIAPSVHGSGARAEQSAAQGKVKRYKYLVEAVGELFFPFVFFTSGAYSVSVSILLKRIRDAGEENGSSDPVGHQEKRDHYCPLLMPSWESLQPLTRGPTRWNTTSWELKRARKRRSHRAVAGEGDAGHGIGV